MAPQREPSVRQLAKKLGGSVTNYQQAPIEDPLEETLDQDDAQAAGKKPPLKARNPAKKRSAPAKKPSTAKSQSKASRKTAAGSLAASEQDAPSLETPDGQSRKRKTSDEYLEGTPFKEVSIQDVDQESVASELSVLGATPEHTDLFLDEPLDEQPLVESAEADVDTKATIESAPAANSSLIEGAVDASSPSLPTTELIAPVEGDAEEQTPSDSIAEPAEAVSPTSGTPASKGQIIQLKLSPPRLLEISQSVPSPSQSLASQDVTDPATSLPTPISARQRPSRTVKAPVRFREPTDALPASIEEDSVDNEHDVDFAGDSPTVQRAARKPRAKPESKTKAPVSAEKVTEGDLASDVRGPKITKAPRRRKADTAQSAPLNVPDCSEKATEDALADEIATPAVTKAPRKRKTDATQKTPRKKQATPRTKSKAADSAEKSGVLLGLPSPSSPHSDLGVDFPVDAGLLKLSRSMTRREPLASKPETAGKPEVWAPGRQELCETLPYFKSAHSGCYAKDGSVYAFMFDSANAGREYMDSDVVIARMGGNMATDRAGVMYQTRDHLMKDKQPQSLLNNIAHRNPLVIVCGDKNEGAITKMPHRYCVLDWFKPTHVWGEKSMSKKTVRTSMRFRFERLDRSKECWYRPTPAAGSTPESESPADLSLPIRTCTTCSKSCPQVYLIDWLCTDPDCTAFWKLPNGQDAPYGGLDYHPAFLQHRVEWEREDPPFGLNPGVPQVDQHFGDSLAYVSTRGVVCPDCGRCNMRYMFTHWRCDTVGCKWKLTPPVQVVMPSNLGHKAWDMASDGPGLAKAVVKPIVHTQVRYLSNYKVIKYTIEGVAGSVILTKASKHVVSEPGGADDMFRELQMTKNVGLERRIMRKTADTEQQPAAVETDEIPDTAVDEDEDEDKDEDQPGGAGARMTAFGMNFGMPYKFVATGDSRSFEDAPAAVRAVRSRLNWAQRAFVNDESGYQDFNEELIFAYLEGQKIKYHDDGEKGLGPRIATLSLGAPATMSLRLKVKYFSQVSNSGVFTDEKPLPHPLLETCGYTSGYTRKAKANELQSSVPVSKDSYAARLAAWTELQDLRAKGDMAAFRDRAKEIPKEINLKRKLADALLSFYLTHGDIVIMEGEDIQKFLEHKVEPNGHLRYAMTCRTVLPGHLPPDQVPPYEVLPDQEGYDGAGIREEKDGGREAIDWE